MMASETPAANTTDSEDDGAPLSERAIEIQKKKEAAKRADGGRKKAKTHHKAKTHLNTVDTSHPHLSSPHHTLTACCPHCCHLTAHRPLITLSTHAGLTDIRNSTPTQATTPTEELKIPATAASPANAFRCDLCNKIVATSQRTYTQHRRSCLKVYPQHVCPHCNKRGFDSLQALSGHWSSCPQHPSLLHPQNNSCKKPTGCPTEHRRLLETHGTSGLKDHTVPQSIQPRPLAAHHSPVAHCCPHCAHLAG